MAEEYDVCELCNKIIHHNELSYLRYSPVTDPLMLCRDCAHKDSVPMTYDNLPKVPIN